MGNHYFLVDCGEGTQYQIQRFGVKRSRIDHILISHLHGDHSLGLMGMIYSYHLSGRKKPLSIYGQRGLDEIITTHLRWSGSRLNYKINFHHLNPEVPETIISSKTLEVISFPLIHRIPTCGFLFREKTKPRRINEKQIPPDFSNQDYQALKKGKDILDEEGNVKYRNEDLTLEPKKSRSYAFCSDTGYDPMLAERLKAVDLVYHEATFLKDMEKWARKTYHATTHDAANTALDAEVGRLLIGHFSARYKEVDIFVDECREIFPETYPALEGEIFEIEE